MPTGLKLYLIAAGRCDLHASVLTPQHYNDERVIVPIWSYLIEGPEGRMLIDTGMPEEAVANPASLFPDGSIVPQMTERDLIDHGLAALGFGGSDIDLVINSHLHFDHAGGNDRLAARPFAIHRREYEDVLHGPKPAPWYRKDLDYRLLDGDTELMPGFWALETPGHAPGHLSFLVQLARSGPILLTVDASYTQDTFDPDHLGAMADPVSGARSIRKLQALAANHGAAIFYGHDLRQGQTWRQAPSYYD